MSLKLLTWPAAFLTASAAIWVAAAAGWSDVATLGALVIALIVFGVITLPLTEGLGTRRRPTRER